MPATAPRHPNVTWKSLTDFILDSALLDRRLFLVPEEKYDAILAQLNHPPTDNPGLRNLFSRPDHWDNA